MYVYKFSKFLCLAIILFNLIEIQTWWINSCIDHFAYSWVNLKVNSNHEIATQKQNLSLGFEKHYPEAKSQHTTNEQHCLTRLIRHSCLVGILPSWLLGIFTLKGVLNLRPEQIWPFSVAPIYAWEKKVGLMSPLKKAHIVLTLLVTVESEEKTNE